MTELALKHGLAFADLYDRDGLVRLDRAFVAQLAATDGALHDRLMAGRANPDALDHKAESDLLVDLAPYAEDFIGELFGIGTEMRTLQARHDKLAPLYTVKRLFVQRRAVKEIKEAEAASLNGRALAQELDNANYCIWCHNQGKDSCRTGLHEKSGGFRKSTFGVTLAGCPLDEKISEMNLVKSRGYSVGALAIVAVDNPICAATGHRICNDCMKACIYQRQEPVGLPQIETPTLKDVLRLPRGFGIYS